ncbi:hypothetical protein YPPY14_1759, partial [Yersinia pestis PY-14]
MLNLFIS